MLVSETNSKTEVDDVNVAPSCNQDNNGKDVTVSDALRTGVSRSSDDPASAAPTSLPANRERLLRRSGEKAASVRKATKSDRALEKTRAVGSKARIRRSNTNNV